MVRVVERPPNESPVMLSAYLDLMASSGSRGWEADGGARVSGNVVGGRRDLRGLPRPQGDEPLRADAVAHPGAFGDDDITLERSSIVPVVVAVVMAVGLLMRLTASEQLSPHVDEPTSVLAAHMVAERGVPILPSGILYLHGATLSYLLAPLVWLGFGDLEDLAVLRLVSVVAGVVAVFLTYRIGRLVTGTGWGGAFAATLVAIDPVSVQWSAHVRMYALLQALTLALVWILLRLVVWPEPVLPRRLLAAMVMTFWLATFAHIGAALLWPPLALVALLVYGRTLLSVRLDVALSLGLCLLALLALTVLGRLVGPPDLDATGSTPFLSFAGEGVIDPGQILHPSLRVWRELFGNGAFSGLMPTVVALLSGLIIGRDLLQPLTPDHAATENRRRFAGVLLACYWLPILLLATFTGEDFGRYLLNVHPLGFVLAALALVGLLESAGDATPGVYGLPWVPRAAAAVCVLLLFVHGGMRLRDRLAQPVVGPGHVAALTEVAAHRRPGEQVIVSLPPVAYLALGGRDDLVFLAGQEESSRTRRYTQLAPDGRYLDYWTGTDSIVTTAGLCAELGSHPDGWVVVDKHRLKKTWAYAGPMATVIRGATTETFRDGSGALVLRTLPSASWTNDATRVCGLPAATEPTSDGPASD